MNFLIIGTGGTGGSIGSFLTLNNEDVTFISRGKNLDLIKNEGLKFNSTIKGNQIISNVKVCSELEYQGKSDVIFVCVKGYSIQSVIPLITKACHKDTLIIPIMNGYDMSGKISEQLTVGHVLGACIYISAFVDQPGSITQLGSLFKIVFGQKSSQNIDQGLLETIKYKLTQSGIDTTLSESIERDTFKKFTFISAFAACGAYNDVDAGAMQSDTESRKTAIKLCEEIQLVGKALNLKLDVDITEAYLKILHSLTPDTTSSLQKDLNTNKKSELDGLVFEVVRLANKLGLDVPVYRKIASHFGFN